MEQYIYGSTRPFRFKLVDTNGDGVPSLVLADNDVLLFIDGVLYSIDNGEIGTEVTYVAGSSGIYQWQPVSTAQTQGQELILDIKDRSIGGAFKENMLKLYTGGSTSAYFGSPP